MQIVPYDTDAHFDSILRSWVEVGWVDAGNDSHAESTKLFLAAGHGAVALVDGEAEALGHWMPGTFWYVDRSLPMCAITSITTSRVARKQGFATGLTARCLREGREQGHAVAALGIFDQGFYDRFGFGTGSYEHRFSLDPSSLVVDVPYRTPVRLSVDDWQDIHRALTERRRVHGSTTLDPPVVVQSELMRTDGVFGLGYRDETGALTHFLVASAKGEHGPYHVYWWAFDTREHFLELLRVLKELSDQVASVTVWQPPGVQMQDFIERPFRHRTVSRKSEHEASHRAAAFWQMRILDLEQCIGARVWDGEPARFALELTDPAAPLEPSIDLTGTYVVTLGEGSSIERGSGAGLPVLQASVNAFTRLWMGVRNASTLAMSGGLSGSGELLASLDRAFALPEPHHGWYF